MAADGLFPAAFSRLHPRFRTPVLALVLQAAWALGLLAWGSYGDLLDWVSLPTGSPSVRWPCPSWCTGDGRP
jgi:amino acid transporter